MGKPQSKRDQQCILMSGKLSRALQEQITKKKCGFNLANYNVHSSVSEFSICCFDSSNKAGEIPLKVELPPQKMPVGTSNPHNILLNSQVLNCCDGLSKSTNSAGDTNDDNCNKIEPFECELQVDTSSEKKQDWSFTLYDFDGKGKITKEELGNLFQALYDAVGSSIRLPLNGTKKLKLRLSIGHDHSHLDPTLKDQSPPLVKKKAKLKNSSRLTEWKEMSLQAGAGGSTRVGMADPKECTKLNNLDASPRAKPSNMSKMENQLTATTPGIGHRLMLSCREQRKLTEMVHENMVRNHVRQQTGRKHHHSGHRHHHHHREARRHRGTRRQGDENRKPREKERTYYLDLGNIERSAPPNGVSLPYSAGIPTTTTTTTATVTTSVMTFARPTIINIVPSSSSPPPPPPPPPTASGSTAHCNEIGMVADDDNNDSSDDVVRLEAGGKGNRRKYDNTWRETGLEEPATGHGNSTMTTGRQDHHNHPHHHHHYHHHHNRRRHHPHHNNSDGGHVKCKHCNEKCAPVNSETVKPSINGAAESENANKNDKKEILNRRHKQNNNYSPNINNDNNNSNEINNNNNNNNNNNSTKDISNKNTNYELVMASGGDMTKQDNPSAMNKCHNSDANLKASFDCVCSRCQKMSCRLRVNYTGSWQLNSENVHDLQQRNTNTPADGRETTAGISTLTSTVNTCTTTATTTTAASSQCDKKTSDRSGKRIGEERHKKHGESYHHAHIGRTLSQERGGQAVTTPVSSSVSAVMSKMTAPGGIPGAMAERKSLRTHYKTDASPQQTASRHRAHCQNTLVPEKNAGTPPSALLPPSVSPQPPTPNTSVATTTSTTTATTMAVTTATTTTNTATLQQQPHHHHHHHHHLRRRNQTSRNMEFNEAMQQVADWINREHNHQQKGQAHSHQGSVNAEHFVHVQRHEHHHVHEYHHHHHYHHYYQT